MGYWPLSPAGVLTSLDSDLPQSGGVVLTAHASAHTKGSWATLSPALTRNIHGLLVQFGFSTSNREFLVDIGVGAAASESVVLSNLYAGEESSSASAATHIYTLPLDVAAGERVAARCQASTGSAVIRCQVLTVSGGLLAQHGGVVSTLGANTTTTTGVVVDPGGSINTKGSWTQVVASTDRDLRELQVALCGQLNTGRSGANWLLDIGVGAAGSEVVVVPNLAVRASANISVHPRTFPALPVSIPAGSRIAARSACSTSDATDRTFGVVLYGVS